MTRDTDLALLQLPPGTNDSMAIKKAYFQLAKTKHPDKGGTKEGFQQLVSAYERLIQGASTSTAAPQAQPDYGENDCEDEVYYDWHYDFFDSGNWDYDDFDNRYEMSAKERAKLRAENIKKKYDYRDTNFRGAGAKCTTCEKRDAITKQEAESHGIVWEEYINHPLGLRTCWACKNAHNSVMTEKKAIVKYKQLKIEASGRFGKYNPIFTKLYKAGKFFTHRPVCNGPSRRNKYYWVSDLELEAQKRGPKTTPRGTRGSLHADDGTPLSPAKKKQRTGEAGSAGTTACAGTLHSPVVCSKQHDGEKLSMPKRCERAEKEALGMVFGGVLKERVERLEQNCFGCDWRPGPRATYKSRMDRIEEALG